MLTGLYAGTFDPITNGHLDIIKRSIRIFDKLFIAIGRNTTKNPFLSAGERAELISTVIFHELCQADVNKIEVVVFSNLLADFATTNNVNMLVRGIRSVSDFEYEINLAGINKVLKPELDTIFLPTSPELSVVSSSMVKEIARHGGDISKFVPACVAGELALNLKK